MNLFQGLFEKGVSNKFCYPINCHVFKFVGMSFPDITFRDCFMKSKQFNGKTFDV